MDSQTIIINSPDFVGSVTIGTDAVTAILTPPPALTIVGPNIPGPQGPEGPPGEKSTFTRVANVALSGHRVVKVVAGGRVDYASADQLADAMLVEGITTGAATMGADIEVQASGEMVEGSWSWALGPIYCGTNGQLTQAAPASAWVRQVATAVDTDRIVIELQPPIITA